MIRLITGGSASGKSEYAEAEAIRLRASSPGAHLFYVATMWNDGAEAMERIERHRMLRRGKGFATLECPLNMEQAVDTVEQYPGSVVLLECLSNLAANVMFAPEAEALQAEGTKFDVWEEECFTRISEDIDRLAMHCGTLLIVTNEIFSDGVLYDDMTKAYIRLMGRLNQYYAAKSERVTEVVYGIAVPIKK